jgi:hypothetical protein
VAHETTDTRLPASLLKNDRGLQGRKQQVSLDGHGGSERPGTQVEGRGIHHRAANPSTMHKPIVSGILILFPAPISILLYVHKRGWGFLATMSVGSNTARVSPPSKRIDNAELF